MPEVDEQGNPITDGEESGVTSWTQGGTPFVDKGPGVYDPFATAFEPGETLADKLGANQAYVQSPFSTDELNQLGERYGFGQLRNLGVENMSPLTTERLQYNQSQGWPGVSSDFWPEGQGVGKDYSGVSNPMEAKPPGFLSKLYSFSPNETISTLVQRAKNGLGNWTNGGPNSPRILTPKEWEDMLPTEREGMLGFLEYIGIPTDDYIEMMKRQRDAVTEAFGIDTRFRPARQR